MARLLPHLQLSSRLGVSWRQRWQFCAETSTAGYVLGFSLGGVRPVAGRQRVSRFACDVDRGGCFSQDRGAGSLEGLGYGHRKPRESSRWQAGRGHRGHAAEEVGAAGAQRPDAVPQVDQSPSQNGNCGTEKVVIKLEGLQKEDVDLTQLLLLEQQEIADAKNDAAEKTQEVETLQAKHPAEVDCDGSVSHVSSASCSSPLSPQQWAQTGGVALRGRSNQVRGVVYQHRFRGQGIHGSLFGGSEAGVSSDSTANGSCLEDAYRDDRDPVSVLPKLLSPRSGLRRTLWGFRQARVRPGHCRRESFKNERALGVGACHGRPNGAGVRGLHCGRFFPKSSS